MGGPAAGFPPPGSPAAGAPPTARARSTRRSGRLLVVLVVVLGLAAGAAWYLTRDEVTSRDINASWERRTSPSGRYDIEFPADAGPDRRQVEFSGFTFDLDAIYVGDGGLQRAGIETLFLECNLSAAGVPEAFLRTAMSTQLLDTAARASFDSLGIEWASTEPIEGLPYGLRFEGVVADRDLVVRAFAAFSGTDLLGAIVIAPEHEATFAGRNLDRILQSVDVLG